METRGRIGIENPRPGPNKERTVLGDMNLDETQMARVREWINQGLTVAQLQSRLSAELGLSLTYMDARLLLADLQLKPKDPPPPPAPATGSMLSTGGIPAAKPGAPAALSPAGMPEKGGGRVAVQVDDIMRPGSLVSGKVTFRDGQTAEWQMDQFGRLAVMPKQPGYKPPQADVMEFQTELDGVLARLGY